MNHLNLIDSQGGSFALFEFNKVAVSLLEQGHNKEAMCQFSKGLFKARIANDNNIPEPNHKTVSQSEDGVVVNPLRRTEDLLQAIPLPPVQCDNSDDHSNFFTMFDKALAYDTSLTSTETNQLTDLSLVTSVYLFNIGLAFHREGIATGISSLFRNSLQFYHLAEESSNPSCDNQDHQLVLFAIHNNMGNIFARFFDRKNARMCYRRIVDLAPTMSRTLSENEAFFATLYNIISGQEMFHFAPAA